MGANDVGVGNAMMGTVSPNGNGQTKWGSTDKSLVGRRAVDSALGVMEETKVSCPDCSFKTSSQDTLTQHMVDCERQAKNFTEKEEAERNKGISEEKVAAMIEKANQPIVSALGDIAALLKKEKAPKAPRKKKRGTKEKPV